MEGGEQDLQVYNFPSLCFGYSPWTTIPEKKCEEKRRHSARRITPGRILFIATHGDFFCALISAIYSAALLPFGEWTHEPWLLAGCLGVRGWKKRIMSKLAHFLPTCLSPRGTASLSYSLLRPPPQLPAASPGVLAPFFRRPRALMPCRKLLDKQMKSERRSFSFLCMPTEWVCSQ